MCRNYKRPARPYLPHAGGLEWLSLSYFLYSLVLALAMLLSLPYWLYQMLRHGKYRSGLLERMGSVPRRLFDDRAPRPAARVIWIHAVSLGEVLAVSGLVEQMRRTFPQHRVLLSTTTDTGQELARKRFGEANVFYFPDGFRVRDPALSSSAAARVGRARGNRILAEFSAAGACHWRSHRGGQCAHL